MKALAVPLLMGALLQAPTFRTAVERVQLDVSATRGGRPVAGLTAADFLVADNGVNQQIASALVEDAALSVQLVLDTSSSVSGSRLQRLVNASNGLLASLRPSDRAGLITFSTAVEMKVPLTGDLDRVRRALMAVHGAGSTSLRDAVQLALETPSAEGTRMLILVFSDGVDTTSWLSDGDVVESARRSGAVVHVVEIRDADVTSYLPVELTEAAGGSIFSASSADDLARLFTHALAEMRARYTLTFAPRPAAVPGWHRLNVKARAAGIDVKARPGYFVNPPR
jgi:Ca-activated chloride channel family protein